MKITFETKLPKTAAHVIFAEEGGKLVSGSKAPASVTAAIKAEKFSGKKGQTLAIPGAPAIVVVGLGKTSALTVQDFEQFGTATLSALYARKSESAAVIFNLKLKGIDAAEAAAAMALGAHLSSYSFDRHHTKKSQDSKPALKTLIVVMPEAAAAKKIYAVHDKVASGVFLTRDLVSEAPNILYPESFADIIKKELAPLGVKVTVLNRATIRKMGMGALAAVGQGSAREEKLVTMEWMHGGKKADTMAFVGKGVTFDTGGISIKPAAGMDEMKFDMGGAGAVTGLMKALALRKAKANVVGVVALAENMPSGEACRPGDIVKSLSGQTVEILNTDAEGRLILCDALWYCQDKFKPKRIVDLATLTGAVIMALGHEFGGCFANDDELADALVAAGKATGEPLWRMPLHEVWDKSLDSPCADIKNIGNGRAAGSAVAAHFLQRFIKKDVKWSHLDIAGVAWASKAKTSVPKGATGFGVRLLDRFVAENCE